MKFICLQGGHAGRTTGATGTTGEIEVNVRVRDRLAQLLIAKGFMVRLVNADPPAVEISDDFDLFLSLHCDVDYPNDNGSGFTDYAEPSTDGATVESQRICKVINETYFPETKINYVNHSNANTRYYYMWRLLSARTPCVLIEMGQCKDPHDSVLLGNTELIAGALYKSICIAFGINPDNTPTIPTPPVVCPPDLSSEVTALKETVSVLNAKINAVKVLIWGKGWTWTKVNSLKTLFPK